MSRARSAARFASFAAAAAGIAYGCGAILALRRFARQAVAPAGGAAASVLVPLHGAEPELAENLTAFVRQIHAAAVQVVFGVNDPADAALTVARAVQSAHPGSDIAISTTAQATCANPKVANLLAMLPLARHGVLVFADSDMRVGPAYVRSVTAPLADARIGAVTCVYGARAAGGIAARFGAAFVNEQFAPSALVSAALGPLRHAFGATIALRRAVLEEIGGLAALGPHLADDHVLGARVAASGRRVALAGYVPLTIAADESAAALWRHEVRWHRTIRAVQPAGYVGLLLTYPLPLALIAFALAPGPAAAGLAAAAAAVRLGLRRTAARVLGVEPLPLALVPLRDAFGLAVWLRGFGGGPVRWRGDELHLSGGDAIRA